MLIYLSSLNIVPCFVIGYLILMREARASCSTRTLTSWRSHFLRSYRVLQLLFLSIPLLKPNPLVRRGGYFILSDAIKSFHENSRGPMNRQVANIKGLRHFTSLTYHTYMRTRGKVPLPRNCTTVGTLQPNVRSVPVPMSIGLWQLGWVG